MNSSLRAVAIAVIFAAATSPAFAQTTTSVSTGGAGGQGGAAAGGSASGGTATNNTSGVSNASGGAAQGGSGGTASGGSANASGGSVGSVSTGGSNAQLGDITVNYNLPASANGKAGLGVGVDPNTGHVVTDNTVTYQGSYKLKNTPDVNVGGPASGPCNGFSGGVGVSVPGLSLGANASTVDEGCSARETARVAAMIGRMDIANAIMDNLPIVQAALKAKAAREALALPARSSEAPAVTSPAQWLPAPVPVQTQEQREAALREQQRLAQEALQRQATMVKVNDTLKFTDATTQGSEKTPQELMAEEATRKLAGKVDDSGKLQTNTRPALPATPPVNKVEAAPNNPSLALQQANKPDTIARAPDRNASTEMPSANQATTLQTTRIEPAAAKVSDNKPSPAALTPEERVKAAKAALNLQ